MIPPGRQAATNHQPSERLAHCVQFYERDEFLVEELGRFVSDGFETGEAVVVVGTASHRAALEQALAARDIDVALSREDGRYHPHDAAETLARIMVDGHLDDARFTQVMGGIIAEAEIGGTRVRAFGEMVALLWAAGNPDAALHLEALWDELGRGRALPLLCAYPMAAFRETPDASPVLQIADRHSHVIPAESYMALPSEGARLRAVALLQHRALALDHQQPSVAEMKARLAAIVESSDDAIVAKTLDGIVTSWNAGAQRVFGYTAAEMIGQPIARLVPPERRDDVAKILGAVARGERIDHFETERVRKDGRRIHISVTVSPIRDATGRIVGASKVARDVSERWRAEQAKDEFLAMLGHELRNPLAAIQSAIVAARLDEGRRDQALEIARRQAGQLRRLVDDLLDMARVAQGKIVLRRERLSLAPVIGYAVETTRTHIEEGGHALRISVPADLAVDADAARLEQVVVNLLTNAAKYTPPGGRIEIVADGVDDQVRLRVRDNGVGISAEALPGVFDLFSQADASLDRSQGGLGLGLALVRRLVELHGGRVEARSDGRGKGSEFVVFLPAADTSAVATRGRSVVSASRPRQARVLLVEDNVDAADALAMLLGLLGHHVDAVHDGLSGLEALESALPDIMIIDIGLPGIDGFEVARRVRLRPGGGNILLVALTGYGRAEDIERSTSAGFDYHLTKPIEIDALEALVARMKPTSATLEPPSSFH